MSQRLGALLVAGLALGACGTVSASSALQTWVHQSNFRGAASSLRSDAVHAARSLRDATSTSNELHTVCGVMNLEALQANASLPTPDAQATSLLSRAYEAFGTGANECYGAHSSAVARAHAVASLERAVAALSEASARIGTAAGPT